VLERSIRSGRWILAFVAAFVCQLTHGQDLNADLLHAIQRATSAIAPNSLELPHSADLPSPPPEVEAAGKDFVNAWNVWTRIMSNPPSETKPAPDEMHLINAATDRRFGDLLKRALAASPPPDPSEFDRFTYSDGSFCADGMLYHERLKINGMALTLLRHGRHFEALRELSAYDEAVIAPLLKAFNVEPEKFRFGAWLDKKLPSEDLCSSGGERTARMMLEWVQKHLEKITKEGGALPSSDPFDHSSDLLCPRYELMQFLRPGNGVTDETKTRYAEFIETRGLQIYPLERWLNLCPKGAEKWLVALAKKGLAGELNGVRKRSSYLLKIAGVEHDKPAMTPDFRFQVSMNGKPWTGEFVSKWASGSGLNVSLEFEPKPGVFKGTCEGLKVLDSQTRDLMSGDADGFLGKGPIRKASVSRFPVSIGQGEVSPIEPWLRADLSLPVAFGQFNRVDFITTDFTIAPQFPDRPGKNEDLFYEVNFGLSEESGSAAVTYRVRNKMPLVLPQVSPGIYWVTVRFPGAVPSPRTKVKVSATEKIFKPQLQPGSSLVVPVDWPEANSPEDLPDSLGQSFPWGGKDCHNSLRSVLILNRKDGSVIKDVEPSPPIVRARFPNSAIFPYLPPGEYVIESPDRTIEPRAGRPGCVIRKSSVSVLISKESPVYVVSEPIKILYEKKNDGRSKAD
jgi:hypothetical protein